VGANVSGEHNASISREEDGSRQVPSKRWYSSIRIQYIGCGISQLTAADFVSGHILGN
jgi:hypothetical protein